MIDSEIQEQRRQIAVEIFDITGQKLDHDDPVVTAALFYSAKIRKASVEIEAASDKARLIVTESVSEIKKAAEDARKSLPELAAQAAAAAANSAAQQEMNKIKSNLTLFTEGLKKRLQSVSATLVGDYPEQRCAANKSVLGVGVALLLMTVLGAMVGAKAFGDQSLTPKQVKELQYGRMLNAALPHLDKSTKEKLFAAMEKRSSKSN